jgi:hypothetical protein
LTRVSLISALATAYPPGLTAAVKHLFKEFSDQDIHITLDLDDTNGLFSPKLHGFQALLIFPIIDAIERRFFAKTFEKHLFFHFLQPALGGFYFFASRPIVP